MNRPPDCPAPASLASRHPERETGFVLVSVLWVMLFLALAVASFTLAVRSHVQETSAEAAGAEARALAEAGVQLALHDLANAQWDRSWPRRFPADGRAYGCRFAGGGRVAVTVEDEAGKIDLNTGSVALLRAALAGGLAGSPSGLSGGGRDADQLAAAILDWRDGDSQRRPGGAEADDYRPAGRPGPKNAAFDSPWELAQVLGVDAPLLARLQPFLTVHSGLTGVDPAKAAPELLALLGARDGFGAGSGFAPRLPAALSAVSPQRVFLVRAQATGGRGATYVREMVVRVSPSRSRLYAVLAWRQGAAASGQPGSQTVDGGDC